MEKSLEKRSGLAAIIPSGRSQFKSWLSANSQRRLEDALGHLWLVELNYLELPHPHEIHGGIWDIQLSAATSFNKNSLVSTGALNVESDARLIKLIGDDSISLTLGPSRFTAETADQARSYLGDALLYFEITLKNQNIVDVVRQKVGEWVDRKCLFSGV